MKVCVHRKGATRAFPANHPDIPDAYKEVIAANNRLKEIDTEKLEFTIKNLDEKYKELANSLKPVQKEIAKLNEELGDTPNENYKKRAELTEQLVNANFALRDINDSIVKQLGKLATKYKGNKDILETINSLTEDYTANSEAATESADDFKNSLGEINQEMEETFKAKVYEDVEKVIEAVNGKIEDQIEIYERAKDRYDAQLKLHYKTVDRLEKEIKGLKEKNDEIERSQELAKFNKDIDKQEKIIENLKEERNLLIYRESTGWTWTVDEKKIAEEQEKLDELKEDLADWERENKINKKEIEKQAAEDSIKTIEDEYDRKIREVEKGLIDISDVIKDDTSIEDAWQDLYITMAETGNTFYTDEIEKLKTFVKNAKDILSTAKLDTTNIEEGMENLNTKNEEVQENVEQTKLGLEDMIIVQGKAERKYLVPPPETPIPQGEVRKPSYDQGNEDLTTPNIEEQKPELEQKVNQSNISKEEDNIASMKKNSTRWLETTDSDERRALEAQNLRLGQELGWNRTSTGIWLKPDGTKAYKKGGIVDYTGYAQVHGSEEEPEAILNTQQTELFEQLVKDLPNINLNTIGQNKMGKSEIYNINIGKVKTNDASTFINNLKSLTYSKGRGA